MCVSLVVMITMLVLGSYLYPLPKVSAQLRAGNNDGLQQKPTPRVAVALGGLQRATAVTFGGSCPVSSKQCRFCSSIVWMRETEADGLTCR